jgi:hypothetical protein
MMSFGDDAYCLCECERIVDAQIQAASGKQDEALQNLSIAAHDGAKYGFVQVAAEVLEKT